MDELSLFRVREFKREYLKKERLGRRDRKVNGLLRRQHGGLIKLTWNVVFIVSHSQVVYRENTNLRGGITVWLTSCLLCLNSLVWLRLYEQQFYLYCQIQTSQTGGQLYSDTSPFVSFLWFTSSSYEFNTSGYWYHCC